MNASIPVLPGGFRHAIPSVRIYYGDDSLGQLRSELARAGCERAVLVSGRTIARLPQGAARVRDALGERCAGIFDGVRAHSPIPDVIAAAAALRTLKADAVVAVGGGSAVVTARAASILLAEGGSIAELCTRFTPGESPVSPKLMQPKLPQFIVPTTPTTAYAKAGSAVVDPETHRRMTMFDPKTRAQALFFDGRLLLTAPPVLARNAALNAFVMAVQGLESNRAEALSDALLLHAVRLLRVWLPRLEAEPQSAEVRGQLALAALLSGQGTDYAPTGLASVIGHAAGSRFGLDAGLVNAVMLPHAIRFNAPNTIERLAAALEPATGGKAGVGAEDRSGIDRADALAADCAAFFHALGLPARLRDLGIEREALPALAEDAQLDWFLRQNPRRVRNAEELMPVLSTAW